MTPLCVLLLLVPEDAGMLRVHQLHIEGRLRTDRDIVLRELQLAPGDPFDRGRLDEGLQRLRNLQIFSAAEATVDRTAAGVDVHLKLQEKWTLLPDIRFAQGGGTSYLGLGVLDFNAFGRALRGVIRGELFGGAPGAEVRVNDPRLTNGPWGTRIEVDGSIRLTRRVQDFYDRAGERLAAFLTEDRRLEASAKAIYRERVSVGLMFALSGLSYGERFLDESQKAANLRSGLNPMSVTREAIVGLPLQVGRLDTDSYLTRGVRGDLYCEHARPLRRRADGPGAFVRSRPRSRCVTEARFFVVTPFHGNLATRIALEGTTSGDLPHLMSLGGFDRLRGFRDGQLRGGRAWYANAELRVPSIRTFHFVLQHVAFLDAGDAAPRFGQLRGPLGAPPASTGLGVRLIAPQIFGAVFRIDYAVGLSREPSGGFALALGNFF